MLRPCRARPSSSPAAPRAAEVVGLYLTRGAGRVEITCVDEQVDGVALEVRISGVLNEPDRVLEGRYDGRVLVLSERRCGQRAPKVERYLLRPERGGAAGFVRTGVGVGLLPASFARFWQARAE